MRRGPSEAGCQNPQARLPADHVWGAPTTPPQAPQCLWGLCPRLPPENQLPPSKAAQQPLPTGGRALSCGGAPSLCAASPGGAFGQPFPNPDFPGPGPARQEQSPWRLRLGTSSGCRRAVLPLRPGPPRSLHPQSGSSACPSPPAGTLPHGRTTGRASGLQPLLQHESGLGGMSSGLAPRGAAHSTKAPRPPPLYRKGCTEWLGHQPKVTQPAMGCGGLNLHRVAGPSRQISASSGDPPFLS